MITTNVFSIPNVLRRMRRAVEINRQGKSDHRILPSGSVVLMRNHRGSLSIGLMRENEYPSDAEWNEITDALLQEGIIAEIPPQTQKRTEQGYLVYLSVPIQQR